MIDIRYIQHLLAAAAACGLCALCMWATGKPPEFAASILSFSLGAAFTSLIVVRLPVFRQYYNATTPEAVRKHRGFANEQAAPIMASLITGAVSGAMLYTLGVEDIVSPAFIGAVCAGVVSRFHRKKR
jgi:hypothetical protein